MYNNLEKPPQGIRNISMLPCLLRFLCATMSVARLFFPLLFMMCKIALFELRLITDLFSFNYFLLFTWGELHGAEARSMRCSFLSASTIGATSRCSQLRDIISPVCPQSTPQPPHGRTCLEHSVHEAS